MKINSKRVPLMFESITKFSGPGRKKFIDISHDNLVLVHQKGISISVCMEHNLSIKSI